MKQVLYRIYFKYFWWVWQLILLIISGFFLSLGIQIVIYAYRLKNPYNFILSFFASNLIILISLVIMAGIIYRMIGVYRLMKHKTKDLQDDSVRSSNSIKEETKQ
jgi:hypothetical protein